MFLQNTTFYSILLVSGVIIGCVFLVITYLTVYKKIAKKYPLLVNNNFSRSQFLLLIAAVSILSLSILAPSAYKNTSDSIASGVDVLVVLDVSKSMNALDFDDGSSSFSRIDVAKSALRNIVFENPENRYGLVAFAGEAINISPLTTDSQVFLNFLSGVDYKNVNTQGTNLEDAYRLGIERFSDDSDGGKTLLLISDGGDTDDITDMKKIKELLKKSDIPHNVIAIGTEEGTKIITGRGIFGDISYQQFNGRDVVTKLNSDKLKDIANLNGGEYYEISDLDSMSGFSKLFSDIEKKSIERSGGENVLSLSRYITFMGFIPFILFILYPFFRRKILS